ncbi:probable methyltransferase-like protein 25 isoform X3 [Daphnia pulicaria]|uniref:probable methyltransferase-like protein 25 isoform X3 n=1 Tax=Daphnia pulicaria TaxID=35523 RepID=UPI001EEA356F|nr:probable methyltransferase-like protein 25 isoform X3 [Daphnia pulicaria]
MGTKRETALAALKTLSTFLEPFLPIVNTHMVHFYTDQVFEKLSQDLQSDLMALSDTQIAELPNDYLNISKSKPSYIASNLLQLMEDIDEHNLDSLNVLDDLPSVWKEMDIKPLTSLIHFDKFMTVKKSHEVGALCDTIASFANYTDSKLIVDLGCGKGALASMLSLNHGLYVSGIDAAGFSAHAEEGRQSMLQKTFKSHVKKARLTEDEEAVDLSVRFRRSTLYLSNNFDIRPLIEECSQHFQQSFNQVGLVGLHTCGNLASTSVQLFVNSSESRFLCNVGCCYHLLDEFFDKSNSGLEQGFPLSSHLKSKSFFLGRNARMVSSQPLERYATRKQMQPDVLFYRSLLQVILEEKFPSTDSVEFQVGRLRKPVNNFRDYLQWATKKLKLSLEHLV